MYENNYAPIQSRPRFASEIKLQVREADRKHRLTNHHLYADQKRPMSSSQANPALVSRLVSAIRTLLF